MDIFDPNFETGFRAFLHFKNVDKRTRRTRAVSSRICRENKRCRGASGCHRPDGGLAFKTGSIQVDSEVYSRRILVTNIHLFNLEMGNVFLKF